MKKYSREWKEKTGSWYQIDNVNGRKIVSHHYIQYGTEYHVDMPLCKTLKEARGAEINEKDLLREIINAHKGGN